MSNRPRAWLGNVAYRLWRFMIELPWLLAALVFRLLYGFRVEGMERVPSKGPFILAIHEHSLIGMFVSGYISTVLLNKLLDQGQISSMSYMQEQLFTLGLFRKLRRRKAREKFGALLPHAAGNLALSLLDGFHVLESGGLVILNPEGDLPWDGRPLPVGRSLAWLALHSGAPIVPALCSPGAYDIWPRWQLLPSLRGRLTLKIGQPFTLTDAPRARCSEDELQAATARIRAEFDRIHFGPAGVDAWIGPATRDGLALSNPIRTSSVSPLNGGHPAQNGSTIPVQRRGMALLLWRCPVCQMEDATVHDHRWFQPTALICKACATRWEIRREMGRDFRLKVVDGPPDLIGVEMGLSSWYDEMKKGFKPSPISVTDVELLPDEVVYLQASNVPVVPHRPNALFNGWDQREAPQTQPHGPRELADWAPIGNGRLLITSHRMLWQGAERQLDFHWSSATAVYLWLQNTLGIRYGSAPYRFPLGQEPGLKWLTYVGTLAQGVAEDHGRTLTTSDF